MRRARQPTTFAPGQRGIALIAVLWLVVLLSLMAASFLSQTRTDTRLTANLANAARLEAAADGAVYQVIWAGLNGLSPEEARLVPQPVAGGAGLQRTVRYATSVGGVPVAVVIEVEGEKLDLNEADEEGLLALLLALGMEEDPALQLAQRILDFRDTDAEPRLLGAEDPDYHALERPWGAKDARFDAVEELQQVLGVSPEIYSALRPYVSISSGGSGLNEDVLGQLGGAETGRPGTADGEEFEADGAAGEEDLDDTLEGSAIFPAGRLIYSIQAAAGSDDGGYFQRNAIVRLVGRRRGYQILEWGEGVLSAAPAPVDTP